MSIFFSAYEGIDTRDTGRRFIASVGYAFNCHWTGVEYYRKGW